MTGKHSSGHQWQPLGMQHIDRSPLDAAEARFEKDIEFAQRSHTHLWIATVVYRVSQQQAEAIAKRPETTEPMLDRENLCAIEFGCMICEQPLMRTLVDRRCPGEPR